MNRFTKIISCLVWLVASQVSWGQVSCPNPQIEDVICSNQHWNWETSKTSDDYCAIWTARTSNGATYLGNPWENASGTLANIANAKDYKHDQGWELIRRDFGCGGNNDYPWFILYNKYNGLMRVYVYLGNSNNTFSRIVGVLEHAPGQKNSAVMSHSYSQGVMRSADAYLEGSIGSEEIILYEAGALGTLSWGVLQYRPTLDPNITNVAYRNNEFSVKIYGYNDSDVTLEGEGVTQPYGIAGNRSKINTGGNGNNINQFTTESQKILKYVSNIDKYRKDLHQKASKHRDKTSHPTIKDVLANVADLTRDKSTFSKTLGTISSVASTAGGVIGAIGSVIGFFTDSAPTPPSPTISNYNFKGGITTKYSLSTFHVKHPGSAHTNNNNIPYYDYPLGICNLKNTPRLHRINYGRYTGYRDCNPGVSTLKFYSSYKVMDDLKVYYNAPAGLEVVSAQAAIVGKIKVNSRNGDPVLSPSDSIPTYGIPGVPPCLSPYKNHMLDDFNAGRLVVSDFNTDDLMLEFQTPYVDIACFKGMAFNVLHQTDVFVRLKVVLKKAGESADTPLLFVQDYATNQQVVGAQEADNRDYYRFRYNVLPPFANHTIPNKAFTPDIVLTNQNITRSTQIEAANSISISNSAVNLYLNGSKVELYAESHIDLKPDFEIKGQVRDFTAVAGGGYHIDCGEQKPIAMTGTFGYNPINEGMRITRSQVTSSQASVPNHVLVFPNPTTNKLFVRLPRATENFQVSLLDQQGKSVLQKTYTKSTQMVELQVQHLPEGLYFLHLKSPGNAVIIQKVVIQR